MGCKEVRVKQQRHRIKMASNTSSKQIELILNTLCDEWGKDYDEAINVLYRNAKTSLPKSMHPNTAKAKTEHQKYSDKAIILMTELKMTKESIAHLTGSGQNGRVLKTDIEMWHKKKLHIKNEEEEE